MFLDFFLKTEPATGKHAKQINNIYRQAYQLVKKNCRSDAKFAQVGEKWKN